MTWFARAMFALGFVARVTPLVERGDRLLQQFPTEDGYLMLTLARNLALGLGMSTAEGTLPSNGTQPLATLLWALVFKLVGGDKTQGVYGVLVLEVLISLAAAYAIYRLALLLLPANEPGKAQASMVAALWFAHPGIVMHTMNCLETGLYGLTLTVALILLLRGPANPDSAWGHWAKVGLALGIGFWARNDLILLCAALAVVHLVWGLPGAPASRSLRFAQLSVAGALVAAIASPWLIFNQLNFGSVVPISGQSEALAAVFAENLWLTFPNLLEYLAIPLRVPSTLESNWAVVAASAALLLSVAALLYRYQKSLEPQGKTRSAILLGLCMASMFTLFYGLWFGAGHFMSRYMFALSPLCVVLVGYVAVWTLDQLHRRVGQFGPVAALAGIGLVIAGLLVREYRRGDQHMHFQVVRWVEANVSEDVWLGAIQTGTLGYFHDRTINLDGKVNAEALAARKTDSVAEYVVGSKIMYLVDWAGIATWGEPGGILAGKFDVKVRDEARDLAVLERRASPPPESPLPDDGVATGTESLTTP